MLTISKDKEKIIVTKGAYEQLFKPLGYTIVPKEKPVEKTTKVVETASKKITKEPVFTKEVNIKSEKPTEKPKKDLETLC